MFKNLLRILTPNPILRLSKTPMLQPMPNHGQPIEFVLAVGFDKATIGSKVAAHFTSNFVTLAVRRVKVADYEALVGYVTKMFCGLISQCTRPSECMWSMPASM
jgi:hypothetical protein